ncbi:VanZ family protein [Mesorhizobium muleiense]|uniref:VanZ family protein n=1 Tax=Mesorhizobium muleiense TaxID=1004279 RepID=UPI003AFA407C
MIAINAKSPEADDLQRPKASGHSFNPKLYRKGCVLSAELIRILLSRRSLAILFAFEVVSIAWFALLGRSVQGNLQYLLHVDDHIMHMAAFMTAGLTAFLLWPPMESTALLFVGAASIEIVQRFIPGRESSLADFAASLSGGALGAAAALIVAASLRSQFAAAGHSGPRQ